MAESLYRRKKQFVAPFVEGLVSQLTGFEVGSENYDHVLGYVYTNLFEHNFATVDLPSVQKTISRVAEKLKIHGFTKRSHKFLELVEKYLSSDTSQHTQMNVQWHVMLLLIKLSYKPTSLSDEVFKENKSNLEVSHEEGNINWPDYLNEGWESFQCLSDDSEEEELWRSALEDEAREDEEESRGRLKSSGHNVYLQGADSVGRSETLSGEVVPPPSLWQRPPAPSRAQLRQQILCRANHSEQWLHTHVQHSWWSYTAGSHCTHPAQPPGSRHAAANMSDVWERYLNSKQRGRESIPMQQTQVVSEFKVMKEVLWMLQVATDTSLFILDNEGTFSVKPQLTLSTTLPDTLRLVLEELCPHFDMLRRLQLFEEKINQHELGGRPAPASYKAYCAALFQQLDQLTQLAISTETKLNKQEETMTLLSLIEDVMPGLKVLSYLHEIHSRAVMDWLTQPAWLCTTRLLSVLYEALLQASDQVYLETSLCIFIHSFHVYLDIIDVWLAEGRLEDWRKEFLIIREEGGLNVMPYEQEMRRCGVAPVSLLSRLVSVVQDAGHTIETVNQLNKLPQLREIMQNKGCLFKEFSENVYNEVKRLKENIQEVDRPESEASFVSAFENSNVSDVDEGVDLDKSSECDEEIQKLFSGKNTSIGMSSALCGVGEGERHSPASYLMHCPSKKYMCKQLLAAVLDDPLLAEALRHYLPSGEPGSRPRAPTPDSSFSCTSCSQPTPTSSVSLVGLMSMHSVLERQLELVITRHRTASCLVVQTLQDEYSLLQHFTVLRTVFFMENGILAQSFYSYLFKEIGECDTWNNSVSLSVQLQMIVEEFYPGFGNYFSVLIDGAKKTSCDVHQAIQTISLAYRVDWPISLVVTQDMINSYNKVFRFLLHLKYSFWTLHNNCSSDLSSSRNFLRVRRLHVMKMWMFYSTNTLHSYFMGLVLRSFARHLEKSIHLAESINVIIEAHNKFLDEVKMHCLQDRKNYIEKFIMKLLCQCSTLAELWQLEEGGTLSEERIKSLEREYTAAYLGLDHCLEAVSGESEAESSLFELKSELNHNVPRHFVNENT